MIKLIALLSACIMMLSGCGCTNDTNDDGIIGNDQTPNDSVMDNGADNDMMNSDTADDDPIVNNDGFADTDTAATDATNGQSRGIVGRALDGVGNAVEDVGRGADNVMRDVGRGANNVMQDVGNALR